MLQSHRNIEISLTQRFGSSKNADSQCPLSSREARFAPMAEMVQKMLSEMLKKPLNTITRLGFQHQLTMGMSPRSTCLMTVLSTS